MTVYWFCLDCAEHGSGDRNAAEHTKATKHGTMTTPHESLAIKMSARSLSA